MVETLEDGAFAGNRGVTQQVGQDRAQVAGDGHAAQVTFALGPDLLGFHAFAGVLGRLVQQGHRQVADDLALPGQAVVVVRLDLPDGHHVQFPLGEQVQQVLFLAGHRHQDHALLRLAQAQFHGDHAVLAGGHEVQVHGDAQFRAVRHLAGAADQSGGAHVLHARHDARLDGFQRGFQQQFLHERVAHLHGRAVRLRRVAEVGGREHRAAQPVPPGLAAHVHDGVPDLAHRPLRQILVAQQAQRHHVHQRVLLVAGVEGHLAAHRGHADRVAVVRDALDHAVQQEARAGAVGVPEAQAVQHRERPRTHREDVTQDAAHARRRALHRLHRRRVVVAFHLERHAPPVPDIHHARVLTGTLKHLRPRRGEVAEQRPRVLVPAVLAPHGPHDGGLQRVRLPADTLHEQVEFFGGQAKRAGTVAQCCGLRH